MYKDSTKMPFIRAFQMFKLVNQCRPQVFLVKYTHRIRGNQKRFNLFDIFDWSELGLVPAFQSFSIFCTTSRIVNSDHPKLQYTGMNLCGVETDLHKLHIKFNYSSKAFLDYSWSTNVTEHFEWEKNIKRDYLLLTIIHKNILIF